MKNICFYESIIGKIAVVMEGDSLVNVFYKYHFRTLEKHRFIGRETKEMVNIFKQIQEYLRGKRKNFDIKVLLQGTDFQKKVWEELGKIPYGKTRSYKEIAQQIGVPNGAPAVGMANHHNPIPLIIPCHRVIGSSGNLVGYGGGLDLKQKLLTLEKQR
jgi:methylated-DNA-[protein]-cysteine S-methyltransferase